MYTHSSVLETLMSIVVRCQYATKLPAALERHPGDIEEQV